MAPDVTLSALYNKEVDVYSFDIVLYHYHTASLVVPLEGYSLFHHKEEVLAGATISTSGSHGAGRTSLGSGGAVASPTQSGSRSKTASNRKGGTISRHCAPTASGRRTWRV